MKLSGKGEFRATACRETDKYYEGKKQGQILAGDWNRTKVEITKQRCITEIYESLMTLKFVASFEDCYQQVQAICRLGESVCMWYVTEQFFLRLAVPHV